MSSPYSNIIKKGLTLKGSGQCKDPKRKKKRSKKLLENEPIEEPNEEPSMPDSEGLTVAEKAFRLAQEKRLQERVDKRANLTHRQRMEKFNEHLATLSNHFDLPKIGG
eukprot:Platyproteum_vivax@DN2624_c0_g1_i1.p1